jgi:hypothetical protein
MPDVIVTSALPMGCGSKCASIVAGRPLPVNAQTPGLPAVRRCGTMPANHSGDGIMDMDYQQYLKDCERIRADNKKLLADFEEWLLAQDLSSKTARKHVDNTDFYINEFLLYEDAVEARHGAYRVGMFLGYWFINKAMWASKTGIKDNAASLKKFYTFMSEREYVPEETVTTLQRTVKERMSVWLARMDEYEASLSDEWDDALELLDKEQF